MDEGYTETNTEYDEVDELIPLENSLNDEDKKNRTKSGQRKAGHRGNGNTPVGKRPTGSSLKLKEKCTLAILVDETQNLLIKVNFI